MPLCIGGGGTAAATGGKLVYSLDERAKADRIFDIFGEVF